MEDMVGSHNNGQQLRKTEYQPNKEKEREKEVLQKVVKVDRGNEN